jgi:predicted nucleotidyltransferase
VTPSKSSAERRQNLALEQAEAALAAELVGSVVWGKFHASSDVDFLIIDEAGLSEGVIYEAVASRLNIRFDLMYLARLRPVSRDLILKQRTEHGRAPI